MSANSLARSTLEASTKPAINVGVVHAPGTVAAEAPVLSPAVAL